MITGNDLLARIRTGEPMTTREQLMLILQLGTPSILAQLSTIVMEYIDAAMVGSLGPMPLLPSVWSPPAVGWSRAFAVRLPLASRCRWPTASVQTHKAEARNVLRQSMLVLLVFSLALMIVGLRHRWVLPQWLGARLPSITMPPSISSFSVWSCLSGSSAVWPAVCSVAVAICSFLRCSMC